MPAIVEDDILPDMGRMTSRLLYPKELFVRRLRFRRRLRRRDVYDHRVGQNDRARPRRLPARHPGPHRKPPDQSNRCLAALELDAARITLADTRTSAPLDLPMSKPLTPRVATPGVVGWTLTYAADVLKNDRFTDPRKGTLNSPEQLECFDFLSDVFELLSSDALDEVLAPDPIFCR
jgi:hypothetical protein